MTTALHDHAAPSGTGPSRSRLFGKPRDVLRRKAMDFVRRLDGRDDACAGIDTSGRYEVLDLPLAGESDHGEMTIGYEAISGAALKLLIAALNLKPHQFCFVDLGCGKGRPLYIASLFPFKKVIGVELSQQLYQIAHRNVEAVLSSSSPVCRDVTVHHADAGTFKLPDSDIVIYMFNPFPGQVLQQALANVSQLLDAGREVIVIYHNPRYKWVVDAWMRLQPTRIGNLFGLVHRILTIAPLAVYRSGDAPRPIGFWPDRAGLTGSRSMIGTSLELYS